MRSRSLVSISDSKRKASNTLEGISEFGCENFVGDIENCWFVDVTIVVKLDDLKSVLEWLDSEDLKKVSFGSINFGTFLDEELLGCDFDGTLEDLGLDVKSVEDGNLGRSHGCTHWWDDDIAWGDSSNLSW